VKTLDELARTHTLWVLAMLRGNRTQTAKTLGISIRTLRDRLTMYRSAGHPVVPYERRGRDHGKKEEPDLPAHDTQGPAGPAIDPSQP
jgi:hypothetical protein